MKKILIIAGPSAVGKTTVAHELLKGNIPFALVRSVTTREPRGDAFDAEYIYLKKEQFLSLAEQGGVLEYTEYAGAFYGTPRSEIDRISAEGKYPLLILDLNGVKSISECSGDISPCAIYIYDDLAVMEARLRERYAAKEPSPNDLEKLAARITKNRDDYAKIENYSCHFYAFVENSREISATAIEVENEFKRFVDGDFREEKIIDSIAGKLSEMSFG